MSRNWSFLSLALASALVPADAFAQPKPVTLEYDFSKGSHGWLAGYTDYSLSNGDLERTAELRRLPRELRGSGQRRGLYLAGHNRSDDLFMYLKRIVSHADGLEPDTRYRVRFELELASNAQSGCPGIGGSPGDSVYLKAGARSIEPLPVILGQEITLNWDKGQQANGGPDASLISTIANGTPCGEDLGRNGAPYVRLTRNHDHPDPVTTDPSGNLWLLVGTDSGFEGLTGLYYLKIRVVLTPVQ